MSTPDPSTRFPTFQRARHHLFSRRTARAVLFLLICFVTLVALLYAIENYRGRSKWNAYRREAEAHGAVFDFAKLIPPGIPDAENFAATPFIRTLFDIPTNRSDEASMRAWEAAVRARDAVVSNRWPSAFGEVSGRVEATDKSNRHRFDLVAWQKGFENFHKGVKEKIPTRDRPRTEQVEAARAVLKELEVYEPVLNEFRANMLRPKARYPVNYLVEDPFSILLPHLAKIKNMAQELNVRVSAELALGDTNAAFNDLMLLIRLADSAGEEEFVISHLVRVACLQLASQPIWEGIARHQWSETQLAKLRDHFAAYDFGAEFSRCFAGERAASISFIQRMEKLRNGGDMLGIVSPESGVVIPTNQRWLANLGSRLAPHGWYEMEMLNYCRYFDRQRLSDPAQQFDLVTMRKKNAALESELTGGFFTTVLHHRFFARLMFPAIGRIALKVNLGQTLANQISTACALEQYRLARGEFPESLGKLVPQYLKAAPRDSFSSGPLKYQRTAKDGFILYSVGADEKDDGGKPGKTLFDEQGGDWVWTCPPRADYD